MARRARQPANNGQNNSTGNANGDNQNNQNTRRAITGPQSALTDFLASHNISARQIREDADLRRQAAQQAAEQNGEPVDAVMAEAAAIAGPSREKATKKGKAADKGKGAKKRKKKDVDSDDDSDLGFDTMFSNSKTPLPGQMENCEVCDKRFTVTPYSVTGPKGGLCCSPCGREIAKQREGEKPQKKKQVRRQTAGIGSRRTKQSNILNGTIGIPNLATLCVQQLAKNVHMAESLGDLPEHLVDKIARIFSKSRLLRTETTSLFSQPNTEVLHVYDGANLRSQDYINFFQTSPNLKRFKARCAIQFKDEVMDYLITRDSLALRTFYLHGANLLSEEKWHEFLTAKGMSLESLQVYYTDRHVGDETIKLLPKTCPNLRRLKIEHNQKVTGEGVEAIAHIKTLQHVGLQLINEVRTAAVTPVINTIGANLQTLSLSVMPKLDDRLLDAMHNKCRSLVKLRITDSEYMTDKGFADLFNDWQNPPLQYIDFERCRYVDSQIARENPDSVGFCSEAFKALMAHSGPKLQYLNLHACRHISSDAFEKVFHEHAFFPELRELEISFCEEVTDYVLGSIFRACPGIKEVNIFGCMKVKHVKVPRGVILVGVPNANGMLTEGDY